MKIKWIIGGLIIIAATALTLIFLIDDDAAVSYDTTIDESLLAINFTIRRHEAYNGEGQFKLEEDYSIQGVVDLFYNAGTNKNVKLVISRGRKKFTYNIKDDPLYVFFPLQLGSGKYDIEIYENVKEQKYKKVYSKTIEVEVHDDRLVFLNTIQLIDWQVDNEAVLLAEDLLEMEKIKRYEAEGKVYSGQELPELNDLETIEVIYRYVVENIRYDFAKLDNLDSTYIPDIEDVFNEKEGICYDYSAILASMLRRLNIPTKLMMGYTTKTDVYHAWNEIYVEDENRWIIVDTTYDSYMFERRKPYQMEKSEEDYTPSSEY